MKALLGATALSIAMAMAGAVPAAAADINIYLQDEKGVTFGHGPHGKDRGPHMRGHGTHHGKHHGMYGDGRSRGHHGDGRRGGGYGGDRDEWRHHGDRHGGRMGHGRRMGHLLNLIELYDRDGDGKVTPEEIDATRADRLSSFDRDGNGTLSLEEYEALWLDAMRERMVDRFQSHDDDGDGQVTVEEFSYRTGRLFLWGDRNEDGAISVEDLRRGDGERRMMREGGRQMMRGYRSEE